MNRPDVSLASQAINTCHDRDKGMNRPDVSLASQAINTCHDRDKGMNRPDVSLASQAINRMEVHYVEVYDQSINQSINQKSLFKYSLRNASFF
jgi:hypothetical protein